MSPRARVCVCGARIDAGGICPRCSGRRLSSSCVECGAPTAGGRYCDLHAYLGGEAVRLTRQPYRAHYMDPVYRHNRKLRYEMSRGRCEACGNPVGDAWECDHLVALRDGGTNIVENLRVHCLDCHHKKTRADRRARKTRGDG